MIALHPIACSSAGSPGGFNRTDGTIVTGRLGPKTYCHDNFGYYWRKHLIRRSQIAGRSGPPYALESKLVYS
jgi:hypothetical protein